MPMKLLLATITSTPRHTVKRLRLKSGRPCTNRVAACSILRTGMIYLGLSMIVFTGGCRDQQQLENVQSKAMYEMRYVNRKMGIPILEAYKAGSRPRNMQELMAVPNVDIEEIRSVSDWGAYLEISSLEFEVVEDTAEVSRIKYDAKVNIPEDPKIKQLEMIANYYHDSRPVTFEYTWKR